MGESSPSKIYGREVRQAKYMGESSPDKIYGREFAKQNINYGREFARQSV